MRPVLSKHDFVERFIAGEFGNRTPTWMLWDDVVFNVRHQYCFRSLKPGSQTFYNQAHPCLCPRDGHYYVSQMIPEYVEQALICQGEVYRGVGGLYLNYSTAKLPMKPALALESIHREGSWVSAYLQEVMCWNSWEWLQYLLDTYEDHVVEFSTYGQEYGTLPNYNTLFWEVRNY